VQYNVDPVTGKISYLSAGETYLPTWCVAPLTGAAECDIAARSYALVCVVFVVEAIMWLKTLAKYR
jgi:hypothetical protein